MSLTLNMVGGGGGEGGLSPNAAVIHVTAPVGSTISFSKGGVVVKVLGPDKAHVNADGERADYYFSVSPTNYGEWTVTATNGTNTASTTVIINASAEYDVTLSFELFIYNVGDQCSSTTGGWGGNGTYTLSATYIDVPLASGGAYANVRTNTKIDLTGYATLYFEWEGSISIGGGGTNLTMWVAPNQISANGVSPPSGATIQNVIGNNEAGRIILGTRQLDVSNLTGEYYIGFHGGRGGGSGDGWTQAHLLKAYLKK